jgi:hypothetical protein
MIIAHGLRGHGVASPLLEYHFLVSDLFEPGMLDGLIRCDSVIRVVNQHLTDEVFNFLTSVGQ